MPTNAKAVLVVGGAGFIGSHMVLNLRRAGYQPVVLDNLSKGHRDAVLDAELIVGDMADTALLKELFARYSFAAVMHFASFIEVGESVKFPAKYYQNNVAATVNLIETMVKSGIKHFIFSSTAAVYGEPQYKTITEAHPLAPINPYGRSKRMAEEIIRDFAVSDGLNYAILRYFNAAGADPEGRLRERHEPESHLIPIVLQAAAGQRPNVTIYGDHYPTADGTCIRDYVHVVDLCSAHLLALNALLKGKKQLVCNLGTGHGYSVIQVVNAAKRVTGRPIETVVGQPRPGDPAILVADASLAKQELHWLPRYPDLDPMIEHAWKAMQKPA
ncbi:UDP-glucose 4-epimerase [Aquicella siphonis]|uniref:UDP-glucose 4-epimerase n=1 Tax=Aquicella siphonis TaxID=254247 RepID=A0A5E4PIS4_9COXI|nr:UDP-glucose 4-epimerase GalE [Aquicella siphonis]VVC76465.1 UDP-glucose 4-epimerase [Aquicella siphonis]